MYNLIEYYDDDNNLLYINVTVSDIVKFSGGIMWAGWYEKSYYAKVYSYENELLAKYNQTIAMEAKRPIANRRRNKKHSEEMESKYIWDKFKGTKWEEKLKEQQKEGLEYFNLHCPETWQYNYVLYKKEERYNGVNKTRLGKWVMIKEDAHD